MASSNGGVHLMALWPVATIRLMAATVALTAVVVLASRHQDPYSQGVPSVTLIYVGADDCAPCRAWYREQWPKFRASREFERLEYRAVESPNLLDVLKDEHWPNDLRAYRKEIEAGAGVPMWLVVSQNDVVLKASGVSKWNEAVFPAIQRLVR
jgi:hypothetical protein